MTQKIRAYGNWENQANDSISEWFWTEIVGKALVVGIAISIPMFGFGALTAEKGVNRYEAGLNATSAGHEFLWSYAGGGAQNVADFVRPMIENK